MSNQTKSQLANEPTCANCKACCCRLEAMLFDDPEVPDSLTVTDARGRRSMARLEDGWCSALDRKTMSCTIYTIRPWICREFEMGEDECLSARIACL
ncbi:Putative zinc-or iron-chelating domain-containing protein [Desulfuromusa kysingii]|uniref:Putative zinc-or iron-chelating domain-containing protein n=1 Tax=Desulfuromusa kysingii TaxID=37625 RepID=A0A1H3XB13_9BACT|nr:YkgJ family cysteine cluster protein [Desulfuromusa kysingii]SDZ96420.1 Putative zinc-or iron-chelating domain-containing protein [Desulfuromusa kysingii]